MSEEKRRKEEEEKRRKGEKETAPPLSTLHSPLSTCDALAPELKAYQDGQLGWWARQRMRRHIAKCERCHEEMQAMRDFSQFLQGGEGESLSPQLRARILAAVPETVPAPAPAKAGRAFHRPALAWGAVASALLLCIILKPLFLKNDHSAQDMAAMTSAPSLANPEKDAASTGSASVTFKQAGSPKEVQPVSSLPAPAAPAFSSQRYTANAPGSVEHKASSAAKMPADKSETEATSRGKSASSAYYTEAAGKIAAPVTKSGQAPRKVSGSTNSPDFDKSVNLAQENDKRAVPPPVPAPSLSRATPQKTARAVAKQRVRSNEDTGDILLLVGNVEQSRATLEQSVKNSGGEITSFKDITYGDSSQAMMLKLTVPAAQLPALLSKLDVIGEREPFAPAFLNRRVQSQTAPGAAGSSLQTRSDEPADSVDDSKMAYHSKPVSRIAPSANRKPNAETLPATAASPKQKAANIATPQASAFVTIHLQEKPRK